VGGEASERRAIADDETKPFRNVKEARDCGQLSYMWDEGEVRISVT